MKKFSDLINENENLKTYKFTATVKVEGTVDATSEGDAGELADKEMDSIEGLVDYTIDSIDVTDKEIKETYAGDNEVILQDTANELMHIIEDKTNNFVNNERAFIYNDIIMNLQTKIEQLNNTVV